MFTFFTINQANEALPDIIKKYEYTLAQKTEIKKIKRQMDMSMMSDSFKEYITLRQKMNSKITEFYRALEALEGTGVIVKSIDSGLLDFPSKRFDKEVWLCWKHGETSIKFWHERDSGFMNRKPIEVDDKSLV